MLLKPKYSIANVCACYYYWTLHDFGTITKLHQRAQTSVFPVKLYQSSLAMTCVHNALFVYLTVTRCPHRLERNWVGFKNAPSVQFCKASGFGESPQTYQIPLSRADIICPISSTTSFQKSPWMGARAWATRVQQMDNLFRDLRKACLNRAEKLFPRLQMHAYREA